MDVSDSLLFYYSVCPFNVVTPKNNYIQFLYCSFKRTEVRHKQRRDEDGKEDDTPGVRE